MVDLFTIILIALIVLLIIVLLLMNNKFRKIESSLIYNEKRSNELNQKIDLAFMNQMSELSKNLEPIYSAINNQVKNNTNTNLKLFEILNKELDKIRNENKEKLDNIKNIVDDKLQTTLEKKIGSSFNIVNEQLSIVSKGLGEVNTLVSDVGDLKRVLQNVKTRGTWGEIQLDMILNDMLSDSQYVKNLKYNNNSFVEFAIKIPSKDKDNSYIYLPIDSKFPKEDYESLNNALEKGNKELANKLNKMLITRIKNEAKSISSKYINPPYTTDFAILYLPFESLYIQVLKYPGILDEIQNKYHVTLSGPTTITALLNSLQLGFKTLAIEKRTSEVWNVLNEVKTEFRNFEEALKVLKDRSNKLNKEFDNIEVRSRMVNRKLSNLNKI